MLTSLVKTYTKINTRYSIPWIKSIIKYIVVRGIGVAIYLGILVLFVEAFKFNPVISAVLTSFLTSAYLYLLSYVWVFKSYKNSHSYSLPRFVSIEILTLFMNTGIMYLVVDIIGWEYIYGVIFGTVLIPLTNFLSNYFWVFNKR